MEKTTPRNRDEEEIMGYRDVLNTIHESYEYIPIRSSYILQLHRDLYQYPQKDIGGRFKNMQNVIAENHLDVSPAHHAPSISVWVCCGEIYQLGE